MLSTPFTDYPGGGGWRLKSRGWNSTSLIVGMARTYISLPSNPHFSDVFTAVHLSESKSCLYLNSFFILMFFLVT